MACPLVAVDLDSWCTDPTAFGRRKARDENNWDATRFFRPLRFSFVSRLGFSVSKSRLTFLLMTASHFGPRFPVAMIRLDKPFALCMRTYIDFRRIHDEDESVTDPRQHVQRHGH